MMEISFYRGHPPFRPPLRIDSIALSGLTFVSGVDAFVGLVSVYMATPPFSGSLSVGGADAASFKIVGSNLVTNGTIAAGTYSITLIATQATANNSPFTSDPFTITGSAAQNFVSLGLSNTTFTPDGVNAVTVGNVLAVLNPASPASTATITLGGTNAASFQLTNGGVLPCVVQAKSTTGVGPYTISLTATQVGIGGSPFPSGNIDVSGSTAVATSITFVNKSASNSPATTPLTVTQVFKRGAVPSGFIAVPTVSGSALTYQADSRVYWDDGSLRVAVFRCLTSQINGGTSKQITFPVSAGSYSNAEGPSGTITTADITVASNFTLAFTNVHTASIIKTQSPYNGSSGTGVVSVKVSAGGAITTGGTVWYNQNGSGLNGTYDIAAVGGGTGGRITVSGSSYSIAAAGSGYAAPASFTASFNSIVASGAAKSIVQYAKGPVCDAWRVRQPLSGMPHFHTTFYVERWKTAAGAFLAFKACAVYGVGLHDTGNNIPNYTFDIDWKNGSTVIRGKTNSDPGFTNAINFAFGSAGTFKRGTSAVSYVDSACMDWCDGANAVWASDAVVTQIIQQRTATECDEIRATGVIPPWLAISPSQTPPSTGTATAWSNLEGAVLAVYQPYANAPLRSPQGSGGNDEEEAAVSGKQAYHWMWLKQGDAAKANIYLVNSRVACAHGLCIPQGSGWFDLTNLITPSIVPNAAGGGQDFTGMTQDKNIFYNSSYTFTGYINPLICSGNNLYGIYHQSNFTFYAYLHDGEQWMLDALYHSAAVPPLWQSPSAGRSTSLGATTYYGVYAYLVSGDSVSVNVREQAWFIRSCGFADAAMPTTWADGSTMIEKAYVDYLTQSTPKYLNALISFTGTYTPGTLTPVNKTVNLAGTGVYPEAVVQDTGATSECAVPFMDDYEMQVYSHLGYLLRGTTTGNEINNYLTYRKNYYIKRWAGTPGARSHFLEDTYRLNALINPAQNSPVTDSTWASQGNVASPALGVIPISSALTPDVLMTFASGNATVTLFNFMILRTGVRIATGSRIKLTTTSLGTVVPSGKAIPTNFNDSTWYYWNETTSTTGRLSTGDTIANGGTIITPGSNVSNLYFWVVPANTLPADNSGLGCYFGGAIRGAAIYMAFTYGTMRQLYAYEKAINGSVSTDMANAVTNMQTIFNATNSPNGDAAFGDYLAQACDDQVAIG